MAEERKQSSRRLALARRGVVLYRRVFCGAYLMRDRLPVREAAGGARAVGQYRQHQWPSGAGGQLPVLQPDRHHREGRLRAAGRPGPAGKLLLVLDDVQARARVATAESGVKAAQAALDAVTHNGTQAGAPGFGRRHRPRPAGPRSGPAAIWMRSPSSKPRAQPRPAKWRRPSSGWTQPKPACTHPSRAPTAAIRRQRWRAHRRRLPMRKPIWRRRGRWWRRPPSMRPSPERSTASNASATEFVEAGQAAAAVGRPAP